MKISKMTISNLKKIKILKHIPYLVLILFIFNTFILASEIILDTFDQITSNFTVLPKSPPVLFSPAGANSIGDKGQALRITSKTITTPVILKYNLKKIKSIKNISNYSKLFFYIKSDSECEIELAFETNQLFPFFRIDNFLPDKMLKKYWQKAEIPIESKLIKTAELQSIYFKITPITNQDKCIFYLDSLGLKSTSQNISTKNNYILYDFNNGLGNIFSAEPIADFLSPAKYELIVSEKSHFGSEGNSLQLNYNNPGQFNGKLRLPILKNFFPFKAGEYKNISWQIRSELNFIYTITLLYKNNYDYIQKKQPFYEKNYTISLPDTFWHKIIFPLSIQEKNELVGILITIPPNSNGSLYLDNIELE